MPYVEVYDFAASTVQRAAATQQLTASLACAYDIPASIITIFFHAAAAQNYGHEGLFGDEAVPGRVFIKLHAYPRSDQIWGRRAVL